MNYARNVAKLEIDTSDELNECMDCKYTSYDYAEAYDDKGNEITSWSTDDHVVCPKCNSFNYFIKSRVEEQDWWHRSLKQYSL
mgnify:FL=1